MALITLLAQPHDPASRLQGIRAQGLHRLTGQPTLGFRVKAEINPNNITS